MGLGGRGVLRALEPPQVSVVGHVTLSPELTEGPYYIGLERMRRNITEGKPGVPLQLRLAVIDGKTGAHVPHAAVDVWHCDAQGVYSGFSSPGPGGPGPQHGPAGGEQPFFEIVESHPVPPSPADVDDEPPGPPGGPGFTHAPDNKQTFLRGVQLTGADGIAEIDTIYPGWYMGRTTHIHVRVHLGGRVADGRYQGGHISHTGQIFLPEPMTDRVYQLSAYQKKEEGRTALKDDGIFLEGDSELATVMPIDPANWKRGLLSESHLVINPAASRTGDAGFV